MKRTVLKIEMLPTSFTVKSPDVTVCEVTEMKPGKKMTNRFPIVGLKKHISFQDQGHQDRAADSR